MAVGYFLLYEKALLIAGFPEIANGAAEIALIGNLEIAMDRFFPEERMSQPRGFPRRNLPDGSPIKRGWNECVK
jgi:hypothetical protein